jgi:hypothetical protein
VKPQSKLSLKQLAIGLTLAANLIACSKTVVMVPRAKPAEINLGGYKRVAIGGIGGQGGDKLVTDLTQALFDTKRFDVLDRQHLGEVMKEQDFGATGRVADDTAASIGNIIGSAALLVGDITDYSYNESMNREKKTCRGKDGKEYACTHYTRQGKSNVAASLKVIDTESGKILAVKNLKAGTSKRKKGIEKQPPKFNAKDSWLSSNRKKVVGDFMRVIAPYTQNMPVTLLEEDDMPELEMGNNMAKLGNWAKAIEFYRNGIATGEGKGLEPDAVSKGYYNLGVAMGYSGDYDGGITELEKAYAMNPENLYLGQVKTIRQFKVDDERLAEQQSDAEDAS